MLMRLWSLLPVVLILAVTAGCPPVDDEATDRRKNPIDPGVSLNPTAPIPDENPFLEYAGLRLGMGALELSQVFNAPKGKGDGFTRVIEYYGDVHNHIINFDQAADEPKRRIVAGLYRDELYILVDDREWMDIQQRDAWWNEMTDTYGEEYETVLPSSQWSWGDRGGVLLTFTQDNASEQSMNGNVVLVHKPTKDAAHNYNVWWAENNPTPVSK